MYICQIFFNADTMIFQINFKLFYIMYILFDPHW